MGTMGVLRAWHALPARRASEGEVRSGEDPRRSPSLARFEVAHCGFPSYLYSMKWYSYSSRCLRVRVLLARSTITKIQGESLACASGWYGSSAFAAKAKAADRTRDSSDDSRNVLRSGADAMAIDQSQGLRERLIIRDDHLQCQTAGRIQDDRAFEIGGQRVVVAAHH